MRDKRGPRAVDNRTTESGLQMLAVAAWNEQLKALNGTYGGHAE